jgi:hypothetical protein
MLQSRGNARPTASATAGGCGTFDVWNQFPFSIRRQ